MYLTRGQAGWQLVGPPLCLQCRCSRPAASPQWLVAGGSWLSSDTCVLNGHWATRSCTGLREHELGRGGQARRSEGGQCLQGHSTAHRFVCFCLTLLETRGEWMRGARKEKEQRTEKWGKRVVFIRDCGGPVCFKKCFLHGYTGYDLIFWSFSIWEECAVWMWVFL